MERVRRDQLRLRQGPRRRQPADAEVRRREQRPESAVGITRAAPGIYGMSSHLKGVEMPKEWSAKRERQYEHIKESEKKEGRSTDRAKEIAARTVNKQRSESGETKSSSKKKSS